MFPGMLPQDTLEQPWAEMLLVGLPPQVLHFRRFHLRMRGEEAALSWSARGSVGGHRDGHLEVQDT